MISRTQVWLGLLLASEGMRRSQSDVYQWCVRGQRFCQELQALVEMAETARMHPESPIRSPSGIRERLAFVAYPCYGTRTPQTSYRANQYLYIEPPSAPRVEMNLDGSWDFADGTDMGSPPPGETPPESPGGGLRGPIRSPAYSPLSPGFGWPFPEEEYVPDFGI